HSGGQGLLLHDVNTGNVLFSLPCDWGIECLAFAPNGQYLVGGSSHGEIIVWNLSTRQAQCLGKHQDRVLSLAFFPDSCRFASGACDSTVRIWDIDTAQEKECRKLNALHIRSVACAPDGRIVAAGKWEPILFVWQVNRDEPPQ